MNRHRNMPGARESNSNAGDAPSYPTDPTDAAERRVEDGIAAGGGTRMQSPVARIYPPRDVDSPAVRCVVCSRLILMNLAWTVSLELPVPVAEHPPRHPTMRPMTQPPAGIFIAVALTNNRSNTKNGVITKAVFHQMLSSVHVNRSEPSQVSTQSYCPR